MDLVQAKGCLSVSAIDTFFCDQSVGEKDSFFPKNSIDQKMAKVYQKKREKIPPYPSSSRSHQPVADSRNDLAPAIKESSKDSEVKGPKHASHRFLPSHSTQPEKKQELSPPDINEQIRQAIEDGLLATAFSLIESLGEKKPSCELPCRAQQDAYLGELCKQVLAKSQVFAAIDALASVKNTLLSLSFLEKLQSQCLRKLETLDPAISGHLVFGKQLIDWVMATHKKRVSIGNTEAIAEETIAKLADFAFKWGEHKKALDLIANLENLETQDQLRKKLAMSALCEANFDAAILIGKTMKSAKMRDAVFQNVATKALGAKKYKAARAAALAITCDESREEMLKMVKKKQGKQVEKAPRDRWLDALAFSLFFIGACMLLGVAFKRRKDLANFFLNAN